MGWVRLGPWLGDGTVLATTSETAAGAVAGETAAAAAAGAVAPPLDSTKNSMGRSTPPQHTGKKSIKNMW